MSAPSRKATTYAEDMAWCLRWILDDHDVWCVRVKTTGLIVRFVAIPAIEPRALAYLTEFESIPVAALTLTQMYKTSPHGVSFGPECAWPKLEYVLAQRLPETP